MQHVLFKNKYTYPGPRKYDKHHMHILYISTKQKRRHRGDVMTSILDSKNTKDSILKVAKYAIETYKGLKEKEELLKGKEVELSQKGSQLSAAQQTLSQTRGELSTEKRKVEQEKEKVKSLFEQSGGYTGVVKLYCSDKKDEKDCELNQLTIVYSKEAIKLMDACIKNTSVKNEQGQNTTVEVTSRCTLVAKNLMKMMKSKQRIDYFKRIVESISSSIAEKRFQNVVDCATKVPGFFECAWDTFFDQKKVVDVAEFPFKLNLSDDNELSLWLTIFYSSIYTRVPVINYLKTGDTKTLDSQPDTETKATLDNVRTRMIYYYMIVEGHSILLRYIYDFASLNNNFENTEFKDISRLSWDIQTNYIWNQPFLFEKKQSPELTQYERNGTCEFILFIIYSIAKSRSTVAADGNKVEGLISEVGQTMTQARGESLNTLRQQYNQLEQQLNTLKNQYSKLETRSTELFKTCDDLSKKSVEKTPSFPWRDKLLAVDGFLSWATDKMQQDKKFFNLFSRVIYENNDMQFSNGG